MRETEHEVTIRAGTTYQGDVFGTSVVVEQGARLAGHLHATREAIAGPDAQVDGNVVVRGTLRVEPGARLGHVLCADASFQGPARVLGDLVVGRSVNTSSPNPRLELRPDVEIQGNVVVMGRAVVAGLRPETTLLATDSLELRQDATARAARTYGDASLGPGAAIEHLDADGDVRLGAGAKVGSVRCGGDLRAEKLCEIDRAHAGSFAIGEGLNAGSASPRGLIFASHGDGGVGPGSRALLLKAEGSLDLGDESRAVRAEARAGVRVGKRAAVDAIRSGGDVTLAEDASAGLVEGRNVTMGAGARSTIVRAAGSVHLLEGVEAGSIAASGPVRFAAAAIVQRPLARAGPGGFQWDARAAPMLWARPLAIEHALGVDAAGEIERGAPVAHVATTLLSRPIVEAARKWHVTFSIQGASP